jgi:L-rhamnose mutarotase
MVQKQVALYRRTPAPSHRRTINIKIMNGYLKTTQLPVYKRFCKVLKLQENKELIEKYKEIHKPENIWPVISRGIKEVGIIDMEIYIKDNMAFMIMDTVPDFDHEKAMKKLGSLPKQKE